MSWDLYVMDLPAEATGIDGIPNAYEPAPIGPRDELIAKVLEVFPDADFADPAWGNVRADGYSIEFNVGDDDPVVSLALHVRGGDEAAAAVARLLGHLGMRAIDTSSDDGSFFTADSGPESLQGWRSFRDSVLGSELLRDGVHPTG